MFLIVEFQKDKSTGIVPQEWYEGGETWWPDFTSDARIDRAVSLCEEPGEGWRRFDVRVLVKASE